MRRIVVVATSVVAVAVFCFIAWLNPTNVDFFFAPGQSLRVPLGWLVVLIFAFGGFLVGFALSLQQLGRRLRSWREQRQTRRAVQIGEWQESGTALAWDGELDRGRTLLKKAWRRQTHNTSAALALASSYMDTGEYDAARQVLEEAVAIDANDADLRYALGEVLRRTGMTADAIRMLETIRVQHPRAPRALLALRELYDASNAWRDAARVQETYIQTLSDNQRAAAEREQLFYYQYQAAVEIGDPAERIKALSDLTNDSRSFVPAFVSLGDALVENGRVADAKKVWERAFRSMPRIVLIERLLAHEDGSRERRRVLALMQKYGDQIDADAAHLVAARVAIGENELDTAAAELQAVSKQDAPIVRRHWVEVYQRRGQLDEALKTLTGAVNQTDASISGYRCTSCGRSCESWSGYCPSCHKWDTCRAATEVNAASRA
jgi:lipopolysaccharide biosynthesis regulator YciM